LADLRTAIVMDYQNIHLTAHGLFDSTRWGPKHEALVHPLHFARQVIRARNNNLRPGYDPAVLQRVLVYRGEPSPDHDPEAYGRNQAQKDHWEREGAGLVQVHLRPLKYDYARDRDGRPATDTEGRRIVRSMREKGIDVLCALALVREAGLPDVDLVILASHDTDLEPALDEALRLGTAKVETFQWFDPRGRRTNRLQPTQPGADARRRTLWNTRLYERDFLNCIDRKDYS
jgi:hypothetical protein